MDDDKAADQWRGSSRSYHVNVPGHVVRALVDSWLRVTGLTTSLYRSKCGATINPPCP